MPMLDKKENMYGFNVARKLRFESFVCSWKEITFLSFLFQLKIFYEIAKFDYSLNKSINSVDKYHTTYNEKLSFSFSDFQKGVFLILEIHICIPNFYTF